MSNIIQSSAIESALILGDLSKLDVNQRLSYYKQVCESVGLNPLTKPFDYIQLNGKLTLYAKRDATDQLRKVHKVSITISSREVIGEIYVVTAKAKDKDGREDESTGAVFISGLKGDNLANAYLKAETKAKRRVTLSICGLGLLDETEVADIPEIKNQAPQAPMINHAEKLGEKIAQDAKASEEPQLGNFKIIFGKHRGLTLEEMDIFELDKYYQWLVKSASESKDPVKQVVKDLIEHAGAFLKSREFDRNKEAPLFDDSEGIN